MTRQPRERSAGSVAVALAAALLFATPSAGAVIFVENLEDGAVGAGTMSDPYRDLQAAIDLASDGDVLRVLPGIYRADATGLTEELCGNCENHRTTVQATAGFVVRGKALHLAGGGPSDTILETGAGYGVYFEDSHGSVVTGVTITGGRRDPDGAATDAGVVARRSTVTLANLEIVDNTDRADDVVVGVGGVMGREGAELFITNCVIRNNGWDGVALYRGATAFIADNEITVGRGAGIGITWDAAATVLRNRVSGYWKGIGSFGSSRVVARNNAVFDNLGWGIVITGTSYMEAANNVVTRNGNCGFALWSDEATGVFTNNIVSANGWREEWVCPQVGIWVNGVAEHVEISHNDVWGNAAGDYRDVTELTGTDGNISIDPAFRDSFDFRLSPGSPCLDSGNPVFTDPDGGPSDMGAHGGPAAVTARTRPRVAR